MDSFITCKMTRISNFNINNRAHTATNFESIFIEKNQFYSKVIQNELCVQQKLALKTKKSCYIIFRIKNKNLKMVWRYKFVQINEFKFQNFLTALTRQPIFFFYLQLFLFTFLNEKKVFFCILYIKKNTEIM